MTTIHEPGTDVDAPGRGRRRGRSAVIAGAAVLAAAAIATPFLLGSGEGRAPAPTGAGSAGPAAVAAHALTGDVDGDGKPDVVTLSRADRLRVRLGSGGSVTQLLQDRPQLEGLADVGADGMAVVTSHRGEGGRAWQARVLRRHHLVVLPVRHRGVIGTDRSAEQTAWLADGRLYDGSFDDLQANDDQVAVLARSWSLDEGKLAYSRVGVRCWDRTTGEPPAPCEAGQDWRYDVGPHGDLPALLPTVHPAWASVTHASFGAGPWTVRKVGSHGGPEFAPYDLIHSVAGANHTARVPLGWSPSLFPAPVRLGDGTDAVLLSQEGGDSDTWRVYVDLGGQVQRLGQQGPVRLGGGFTQDGDRVYLSWLTPAGSLFTRVGTVRPGHYRVYAWQPSGGDATTPPTLVAHDLGPVCIDDMWQTYGTCR
jgi:hypothetical protein